MFDNRIGDLLYRLEGERRRRLQPLFNSLGLTSGQPRILHRLLEGGGSVTQRELADACALDAATLSRALDRLVEDGLVSRTPHGSSRRANLITLTPRGEALAADVSQGFCRMDEAICAGFSPSQLEWLAEALGRVLGNLEGLEDLGVDQQ